MPIETWVQIFTLSLIILVPMAIWFARYRHVEQNGAVEIVTHYRPFPMPSWWAVGGCVMYSASYFISNAFHLAFWALPPLPAEIANQLAVIMADAPASAYGFALRLYQASTLLLVAIYSFIIVFALRTDLQARLVWLVLAIAESFAVLEYANCKLLVDPFGSSDLHLTQVWGVEVSRYACGRILGVISPYVAPLITSIYLLWVNSRRRLM